MGVTRWVGTPGAEASLGLAHFPERSTLSKLRDQLVAIVLEHGHLEFDEPVLLASGDLSRHFIDGKRALARGDDLRLAAEAILDLARDEGLHFDAVGGLTMGADQFAHAVALVAGQVEWFSVRKETKERGTKQRIEGAQLAPGRQVLLVDDVVTRGGSILDALAAIRETGATVVCAVTLVDRGHHGREKFEREGIPYRALLTFEDLGIPAVGSESGQAAAAG